MDTEDVLPASGTLQGDWERDPQCLCNRRFFFTPEGSMEGGWGTELRGSWRPGRGLGAAVSPPGKEIIKGPK